MTPNEPGAPGWSTSTIRRPSGVSETGISLRFAQANGMPIIVTASAIAVTTCPIASHQPATTNHTTLPSVDPTPASGRRSRRWPKGHSANRAIRNDAIPHGMVTISTQQMTPAMT